jgi:hypothetical protein
MPQQGRERNANKERFWRDVIRRWGRSGQTIRGFCREQGVSDWLFVGGDSGGRTAAVLFSFTATCKYLSIDSFAYLRDVLGLLPTHPAERLEELLPHRWQALHGKAGV